MACCKQTDQAKHSDEIDKKLKEERKKMKKEVKILLLGPGESGKSTVFKQMKIIQRNGGFSTEELMEYKYIIFGNCISQMRCLSEAAKKLDLAPARPLVPAFERMLKIPPGGDSWSPEVASDIRNLWADSTMRAVYERRDKDYQLNDSAAYFFNDIDRFINPNYVPTQDDVLRARIRTTGIQEAEFQFDELDFRMLDVGGQRSERRKWIHCFDSVTAVIFCVALSEYDQCLREDLTQNRMKESLLLFDEVCNSHWFKKTAFILFLNKLDLFREKIARVDLNVCFENYRGGLNFDQGTKFIKEQFEERNKSGDTVYTHFTCAINTENIEFVFGAVRELILHEILDEIVPQ